MKHTTLLRFLTLTMAVSTATSASADISARGDVADFIDAMVAKHRFERPSLSKLFGEVEIQQSILDAISKPAEALPWHKYRKIFLTRTRIDDGVEFWRTNESALAEVERRYGVPPEMIVAIIGVETRYGANTGSYRVIDALSTLGFAYPKRSRFFRSELENFLLLCRDEGIDPTQPTGSYAGAMGVPQFMPSSFRHYAADFDGDRRRDIWENRADAIASVANYFSQHGWRWGEAVTVPVKVQGRKANNLTGGDLKPTHTAGELARYGVAVPATVPPDTKAKLIKLDGAEGPEHWLGLHNFYVITRYNHSPLYAMAAYQLSREIKRSREARDRS